MSEKLPTEDGTTQIDHVLISEFGVFVVETRNMLGDRDTLCARYKVLQGEVH
jgi:hypothetical protein